MEKLGRVKDLRRAKESEVETGFLRLEFGVEELSISLKLL